MNKQGIITGATSGIGAAFARAYAKRGYDLILVGRRQNELTTLKAEIEETFAVKVKVEILDLIDAAALDQFISRYNQESIDFLINNAGYGNRKSFFEDTLENQMKMVEVHNTVVLKLLHSFKPIIDKSSYGQIINVSSLMGFYAIPGTAMYSATKAFLILFTQAMALENTNKNLKIQVLCPGLTRTDFHRNAPLSDKNMKNRWIVRWMTPEAVVRHSLKDLKSGKIVSIPGFWNRFTVGLLNFLPESLYKIIAQKAV